jgi:hypothetical protein
MGPALAAKKNKDEFSAPATDVILASAETGAINEAPYPRSIARLVFGQAMTQPRCDC